MKSDQKMSERAVFENGCLIPFRYLHEKDFPKFESSVDRGAEFP